MLHLPKKAISVGHICLVLFTLLYLRIFSRLAHRVPDVPWYLNLLHGIPSRFTLLIYLFIFTF